MRGLTLAEAVELHEPVLASSRRSRSRRRCARGTTLAPTRRRGRQRVSALPTWGLRSDHSRSTRSQEGARSIRGGHASVGTVLYLAAMNAARFDPVLRALYQRSQARVRRRHPEAPHRPRRNRPGEVVWQA
jgi:hypothetical protein